MRCFPAQIIALAGLLLLFACGGDDTAHTALATVDGATIDADEFRPRLQEFLNSSGLEDSPQVRSRILDNVVNEYVLEDYVDASGLKRDPKLQALLDYHRKKTILAAWKQAEIKDKIDLSDADIRAEFQKSRTRIRARHLFAPTEKAADSLRQLLLNGTAFEDLARQVFRDPRLSLNGGDLGYFTAGEMDPAFEEAAFNLPPGEVSVPVQTENGYSIIRVEDRQVAPLVTETEYANQKKIIRRYLRWKREKLGERGYIRDVLKTADPRFDRSGLSALLAIIKDLQANPSSLDTLYINLPRDVQDQYGSLSCVQFENEKWDVQAVVARLAQVAPKHLQLVQDEASLKMLLHGLVARELLYQRALDMGVDDLKSTREALAKAQRYAKSRYMRLMVYDTVAVPEAELREAYEKRRHEYYFPEEVRVQVLIAGDSLTALRLRKMALEGSDFTALVHQHSLGIGERNPDGIFDWSPRGKFGTFADQIFELKVAQITAPVKGEGYYLLFKLLDRRPRRDKTFSEARGQIEAELLPPRQRDRFLEFIRRERRQRQIVKDPDALAKMPLIKSAA